MASSSTEEPSKAARKGGSAMDNRGLHHGWAAEWQTLLEDVKERGVPRSCICAYVRENTPKQSPPITITPDDIQPAFRFIDNPALSKAYLEQEWPAFLAGLSADMNGEQDVCTVAIGVAHMIWSHYRPNQTSQGICSAGTHMAFTLVILSPDLKERFCGMPRIAELFINPEKAAELGYGEEAQASHGDDDFVALLDGAVAQADAARFLPGLDAERRKFLVRSGKAPDLEADADGNVFWPMVEISSTLQWLSENCAEDFAQARLGMTDSDRGKISMWCNNAYNQDACMLRLITAWNDAQPAMFAERQEQEQERYEEDERIKVHGGFQLVLAVNSNANPSTSGYEGVQEHMPGRFRAFYKAEATVGKGSKAKTKMVLMYLENPNTGTKIFTSALDAAAAYAKHLGGREV